MARRLKLDGKNFLLIMQKKFPAKKFLWDKYFAPVDAEKLLNDENFWHVDDKLQATRASSGVMINRLKDLMLNLIGGSADLGPSNKTIMKNAGDFGKNNYGGRNLHFGVCELAMAAITNGLILHGGLHAYC